MKKKIQELKTDLNKIYIVPIIEKSTQQLKKVQCMMVHVGNTLLKTEPLEDAELYEEHRFIDNYFQFLIYRKYISEFNVDDLE